MKSKRLKLSIGKNYKICHADKVKITEIRRHTSYKFKIINLQKNKFIILIRANWIFQNV